MLLLIESIDSQSEVARLRRQSGFFERLAKLFEHLAILNPSGNDSDSGLQVYLSLKDVAEHWTGEAVAYIQANQVFFDDHVVENALRDFADQRPDYLTQWEHVRLPVGLGIRIATRDLIIASQASEIQEFITYVNSQGNTIKSWHDPRFYTSHAKASLSALWPSESHEQTIISQHEGPRDLSGFLQIAAMLSKGELTFQPDPMARCVDDRGMAAAYGFESVACAEFPTYLMFDLTNKCNATCIHCPHSVGFPGMENATFLQLGAFKKAIDEASNRQVDFVRITADGEPLLHPEAFSLISYAVKNCDAPVSLTTNGSALNQRNIERLLDTGLFMIDISLDAATKDTYETVRAGLDFHQVMENVQQLIAEKSRHNSPLKVMVSFVKQTENMAELEAFCNFWESKVDEVLIREMNSNVGINDNSSSSVDQESERWPCPHWFRRVVVNYDGLIKACPVDWENRLVLENSDSMEIGNIWHGDWYHSHRLHHLNGTYPDGGACSNCQDWRGTPWSLGYEKVISRLVAESEVVAG